MKAGQHPEEGARIAALRRYDILDTPRESDFDDVAAFASALCGTPISVINLIDADRQWFKAEVGLGVRETPLDTSLCAHIILEDDFVEIPDTLADPRMRDNPLCLADGGLRFYAGALLKTADGLPVGTLCVLDHAPRALTDLQRHGLRVLATQVVAQLDLRATLKRETLLRREIDHRVKNSLQSVSAFVRLRRRATDGEDAREALGAVEQQIGTVAVLHELLGESSAFERVELADYLRRVVRLLGDATPANVSIEGRFDPLSTRGSTAASLGTIVNELVANAVKHSFEADTGGRIDLSGVLDGATYRITCRDDGNGKAEAAPPDQRDGLGLRIMTAAVRQLDGSLVSAPSKDGFTSLLEFPVRADR